MSQIIPFSQRFGRNIRLTHHVRDRMKKRGVSEAMLLDLIETGELRHASASDFWIFKHYNDRKDNLVCTAVLLAQAVIVKTVMVDWRLEEDTP